MTWVNEIMYQILNKDNPEAMNKSVQERWIFMENSPPRPMGVSGLDQVRAAPSPRFIKSHLPARYFSRALDNPDVKIIVPMRNPKDTLVSLYHFYQQNPGLGKFPGTWEEFFELHRNNRLYYENLFKFNVGWLEHAKRNNVYIIKYEECHKDVAEAVRKLAAFLEVSLTANEVDHIVKVTSMDSMRNSKAMKQANTKFSGNFFRKGKVGDWENYMSEEQSSYIDKEYEEKAKPVGLEFDFKL